MRKVSDRERIEAFFKTAPEADCKVQLERINLIMELRGVQPVVVTKRARKQKGLNPAITHRSAE